MIQLDEQNQLFTVIASQLKQDISCIAFGGTAMMYYSFKQATKDIDLLFSTIQERKVFVEAIQKLGYKEDSKLLTIYSEKKRMDTTAPIMFTLKDERFDLFAEKIFKFEISQECIQKITQIHEFKDKYTLKLQIISPEDLVLLKSLTDRKNDFEDILSILTNVKTFDWQYVIAQAKKQRDGWILLDVEQTMQKLKDHINIPKSAFEQLYGKA